MKPSLVFWFITCFISLTFISCDSLPSFDEVRQQQSRFTRTVENFGNDWQFHRIEGDSIPPVADWETVNVPHTVRIEPLVVNDQWQGTSLYQKSFDVNTLENKKWFFLFEGVMQEARVSVNDSVVKVHKGGYLPFTVDATPFLREGETNTIQMEVLNVDDSTIPPGKSLKELDFNYYGGIYRNVHLIKTNPLHITNAVHAGKVNSGGVLIHFENVSNLRADGLVKVHLQNDSPEERQLRVRTTFTSPDGKEKGFLSDPHRVRSGRDLTFEQRIDLEEPELWSTMEPNLYNVRVQILEGGRVIDRKEVRTGIRDIRLEGNAFYLNGEEIFMNGTNRHQEYPYVGYALSDEARYRDAFKIKQAGFNFVRLSHYPQATAFLEACDELGLLVMNAIPGWQYYEEGEFVENALQDIKDMIRRDRNHPSVVFWENSLNEAVMSEDFMIEANRVLKAELPYEDTYSAGWIDHPSYDLFIPARQHSQPPDYWSGYDKEDRPILIAEYGDWEYYAQNAGFNQSAFSELKEEERTSRQLREAGEQMLLQQALNFQEAFNSNLKGEQTVGMANWLMFDYNRGYADDLEASGIADIFRIPKFSYYFYKSQKSPYEDSFSEPMVFIANYWTPKSTTNVKVFSNTEEVALFLNGVEIERKTPERNRISDELPYPPFEFELKKFQAGELKAVGFINGEEVATYRVRTPGAPAKIDLAVDRSGKNISRDDPDVVFVYAIIRDGNGIVVPTAENEITFTIETTGENLKLIGENPVQAEAGVATILLRTEQLKKPVAIQAEGEGLVASEIIIKN